MTLYQAARERNVLLSPGCFFRPERCTEPARADAWMRVNVSRCEGSDLAQVLQLLREPARA